MGEYPVPDDPCAIQILLQSQQGTRSSAISTDALNQPVPGKKTARRF
jgi:hypothetical protein